MTREDVLKDFLIKSLLPILLFLVLFILFIMCARSPTANMTIHSGSSDEVEGLSERMTGESAASFKPMPQSCRASALQRRRIPASLAARTSSSSPTSL